MNTYTAFIKARIKELLTNPEPVTGIYLYSHWGPVNGKKYNTLFEWHCAKCSKHILTLFTTLLNYYYKKNIL